LARTRRLLFPAYLLIQHVTLCILHNGSTQLVARAGTPELGVRASLIDSINIFWSTMPFYRTSINIDFVPPTQYHIPPTRGAKQHPQSPSRCPHSNLYGLRITTPVALSSGHVRSHYTPLHINSAADVANAGVRKLYNQLHPFW
jgi:hypothetical protein